MATLWWGTSLGNEGVLYGDFNRLQQQKQRIGQEMTSGDLLMYVLAPQVFQLLKKGVTFPLLISPIRHRTGGGKSSWLAVMVLTFH